MNVVDIVVVVDDDEDEMYHMIYLAQVEDKMVCWMMIVQEQKEDHDDFDNPRNIYRYKQYQIQFSYLYTTNDIDKRQDLHQENVKKEKQVIQVAVDQQIILKYPVVEVFLYLKQKVQEEQVLGEQVDEVLVKGQLLIFYFHASQQPNVLHLIQKLNWMGKEMWKNHNHLDLFLFVRYKIQGHLKQLEDSLQHLQQ